MECRADIAGSFLFRLSYSDVWRRSLKSRLKINCLLPDEQYIGVQRVNRVLNLAIETKMQGDPACSAVQ
jgi:hypothetical protein